MQTIGLSTLVILVTLGSPGAAEAIAKRLLPHLISKDRKQLDIIASAPGIVFMVVIMVTIAFFEFESGPGKIGLFVGGAGFWFSVSWASTVGRVVDEARGSSSNASWKRSGSK